MEINFNKVTSIANAMSEVFGHRNEINRLIKVFAYSQSSLASILSELETDIVNGFSNVVNAIKNETLTTEWGKISNTLGHVFTTLSAYKQDLTTVQIATTGTYVNQYVVMTENGTKEVLFSDWCLGYIDKHSGISHRSILDELGGFIGPKAMECGYSSLVGIFSHVAPDDSSGDQGYDAISIWTQIITLAKTSPSASILGTKYIQETQYESMLRLMSCTHTLIAMTLYIHDTALQLLINITKSNSNRFSLLPAITTYFGDCSAAGTVWNKFATALEALTQGSASAQLSSESTSYGPSNVPSQLAQQLFVGSYTQPASNYGVPNTYIYNWHYCGGQYSLTGTYPNSFFASLGFVEINPSNQGEIGYRTYLGLQGTVVTIGPGLTYTNAGLYPSQDSYADMSNWSLDGGIYVLNNQFSGVNTYESSYVDAPAPANNNQVTVITGFQLTVINNGSGAFNVGVALQFGILDVSDINTPTVTVSDASFIPQNYTEAMEIQEFFNMNQIAGYDDDGNMKLSVLTNVALTRGPGGADGLVVQVAPTYYTADFFQPDKMEQILAKPYQGNSGS